jgi:hypothetical protein
VVFGDLGVIRGADPGPEVYRQIVDSFGQYTRQYWDGKIGSDEEIPGSDKKASFPPKRAAEQAKFVNDVVSRCREQLSPHFNGIVALPGTE